MPRLRRSDCSGPGLARRRHGRGFGYVDEHGTRVTDEMTLERLRALAIPPAWNDVWICPDPQGHLQAVGTDAAGRRQYRYHDRWRERRDRQKFDDMLDFARALPRLRRTAGRHLSLDGMPRERVLGCAVVLLDRGCFRIGSEEYAESNGTYGLATLERRHVSLSQDSEIVFDYEAKGGQQRLQTVTDPGAYAVLERLKRRRARPGDRLLAYRDGRDWVELRSFEINDYIKELAGGDYSAKAFRTWNATVLAAVALAAAGGRPTKRRIAGVVREVAEQLGNTPAVCRASYIDPRVFDRYRAGSTIDVSQSRALSFELDTARARTGIEAAVLDLLEDAPGARAAA